AAALVETLARAVHAAHQAGVLHRDLKPANVLLTREGTPKVSDFGLAKLLDDDSGRTRTGQVLGTPSYMAPEQARGDSRDAGPAADVYAVGAILYEGLPGRPPFQGATPLDTLDLVRTQEPVPPRRLQPRLPRDLETICLKCLHKEPARRFASAEELADDLGRFLAGEPVRARRTSVWGRAAKWARRRPVIALLGGAVVLSLLTGFGLVTWQWLRAEGEWQRAEAALVEKGVQQQATERARREAARKAEDEARARQAAEKARDEADASHA